MSASDIFEFGHTESLVQVTKVITVPDFIAMVNNRIIRWGELVVPVLINIAIQSWRPPYNVNSGLYWFSGFCKVFNTTPQSDNLIFAVLDINSYDENYTNYIGRIFYGKKNDTTYENSTIIWLDER